MKKVLVTGSSGKLGKAIVQLLQDSNYDVLGIDLVPGYTTNELIDIRDENAVLEVASKVNVIIHTAALHGKHTDLNYSRKSFIDTNVIGTNNLLSASIKTGIKKFLYTSSTSIYGKAMVSKNAAVWVDEKLRPEPRDIYDITKLTCELLCQDYFEKEGLDTTVLRVSRFLPEDDNTKANHRIYRGLDERDGAKGHLLALEKKFESFEIFNISSESPFQKEDLVALTKNPEKVISKYYTQAKEYYKANNWEFPKRIDRVYSIEKAKNELSYSPKYNYESLISLKSSNENT